GVLEARASRASPAARRRSTRGAAEDDGSERGRVDLRYDGAGVRAGRGDMRRAATAATPTDLRAFGRETEAMLTNEQKRKVVAIWNAIDDEEDDVSTERLFALTCDCASQQLGVTIDDGDVSDALVKFGQT